MNLMTLREPESPLVPARCSIELPSLPPKVLKRALSGQDCIVPLESKRQKQEQPPILNKAYPSETAVAPPQQAAIVGLGDSIKISQLIRTPSFSHQEISSDNGKRKWIIVRQLGKGGCGEVFLAREVKPNVSELDTDRNPFVALKVVKDKKQYQAELKTMKALNDHPLGKGNTPKLICACRKSKALVMEYLSESLSHQFEKCQYKLSLKSCLMLAINMLELSREFYQKTGQVHVDIKPSNFCTGEGGRKLALIDFGYSTHPETRLPGQTGTPLFMAWTIQTIGNTYPTWQDDLESIGYVLMFFIAGGKKGLPWGHLRTHKDISRAKNDISIRDFCYRLKGTEYEPMADALELYLFLTRNRVRPFQEVEDYQFLLGLFDNVMRVMGFSNDGEYDWVKVKRS